MVKLNKKRIKEIINKKHEFSTRFIADKHMVTEIRVQQLIKEYKETKKY